MRLLLFLHRTDFCGLNQSVNGVKNMFFFPAECTNNKIHRRVSDGIVRLGCGTRRQSVTIAVSIACPLCGLAIGIADYIWGDELYNSIDGK